jgi:hypothetical protein
MRPQLRLCHRLPPQSLLFLGLLALVLISACASLGIAQPQGIDQRLAYTAGQITALRGAAADALAAKSITADDAEKVLRMTDDSRALLDGARAALRVGDMQGAESRLLLATNVLTALRAYLGRQT